MYIGISGVGYLTLGGDIIGNITKSLEHGEVLIVVNIMIMLHLLSAFTIVFNPALQEVEEKLAIPHSRFTLLFFT